MKITIRKANHSDIHELNSLFKKTIINVNKKDYSQAEILDWASCGDDENRWRKLIDELYFIVAEDENKKITGFSSISSDGYLHSLFIHHNFQQKGVASKLYEEIEDHARKLNLKEISTEASITAKTFFKKKGFKVINKQKRKAKNLHLTNFVMKKMIVIYN